MVEGRQTSKVHDRAQLTAVKTKNEQKHTTKNFVAGFHNYCPLLTMVLSGVIEVSIPIKGSLLFMYSFLIISA